jgi:hypothetical protein
VTPRDVIIWNVTIGVGELPPSPNRRCGATEAPRTSAIVKLSSGIASHGRHP